MGLTAADLGAIEALLAAADAATACLPALRARFPGLSVTGCDPSDVDTETPFRTWPHVSLYLVDGSSHCWRLTGDPAHATGVVVVAHRGAAA